MTEQLAVPWGEIALYQDYAQLMKQGMLPYRDFFVEYPPFALVFFYIANLFGSEWFTFIWYEMIGLFILGTSYIIAKLKGNAFIFLASILPLGGLLWDRFDMIPVFLTMSSLYLLHKKHFVSSYVVLGVGFLTKVYPIIVVPYLLSKTPLKHTLEGTIWMLVTILSVIGLIVAYGGTSGLKKLMEFQGKRGIQIESVRALPFLFSNDTKVIYAHNTFEVTK